MQIFIKHVPRAATPAMDPTAIPAIWPDVKPCGSSEGSLTVLLGWSHSRVVVRFMDVDEEDRLVWVESDSVLTDVFTVVSDNGSSVTFVLMKTTEKNKEQPRVLLYILHTIIAQFSV